MALKPILTLIVGVVLGCAEPRVGDMSLAGQLPGQLPEQLPGMLSEMEKQSILKERDPKPHVESALKAVGLAERMGHYPRQLSGGQEQRVAIARAIVTDPTILVADEPTGDLDAKSAEEILILLTQLKTQFDKTIVMVTHDPRSERFVDAVYRLDKGVFTGAEKAVYLQKRLLRARFRHNRSKEI